MGSRVPLTIDQGTTFSYSVELTDDNDVLIDTSDLIANSAMRKSYAATNAVYFTTAVSNSILYLSLSSVQTAALESGRYVYDVLLRDTVANTITRPIEGVVTVKATATR